MNRPLRDAELAALLAESPWERMQRDADDEMAEEVDRAFERIVVPEPETAVSQVRLRAHVTEPQERATRARRTR